eukprot:CAMPEP_0113688972 /NCGR_PEP_ID=MMETSP0038_2-20120614/16863_1 /TAXON_ID=2898 /ORGANISM="Cryptomonas paramecium" /LENGTH=345 /DNA_ID=CAMNT_0000609907 /DNA_START=406 /DNA_END=1440 /DNA_ORIENTATION=- /assembly_acc=CAM_ASM_000170
MRSWSSLQPNNNIAYYRSALRDTALAISAAIAFGIGIGYFLGGEKAMQFFTGYVVEESLAIDNLFVFILLFEFFKVPAPLQPRVLRWGLIGAALLRGAFIAAGLVAIESFKGVLLVFAGLLIFSSYKILLGTDDEGEEDLAENAVVKFASRLVRSTTAYDGDRFFTIVDGVTRATPLFLVLVSVELSDILFAVDSIPAVFGVTSDPLIVLSSNLFAVVGLRSLFQIVAEVMKSLRYLEQAVGMVLGFVGMKMAGSFVGVEIPPAESLGIILTLLGGGVTLSYLNPIPDDAEQASNSPGEAAEEPAMDGAKRALDQVDKVIPASLQRGLADGRLRFPELESWVRSA